MTWEEEVRFVGRLAALDAEQRQAVRFDDEAEAAGVAEVALLTRRWNLWVKAYVIDLAGHRLGTGYTVRAWDGWCMEAALGPGGVCYPVKLED